MISRFYKTDNRLWNSGRFPTLVRGVKKAPGKRTSISDAESEFSNNETIKKKKKKKKKKNEKKKKNNKKKNGIKHKWWEEIKIHGYKKKRGGEGVGVGSIFTLHSLRDASAEEKIRNKNDTWWHKDRHIFKEL